MSAQVESFAKTNQGHCGCGCKTYGTLRTKPWRSNGIVCVRRGCPCKQCMGRASKSSGGRRQRQAAKALGLQTSSIRTGHEEHYQGAIRMECKSGFQALPVWTRYLDAEAQSNAARSIGDNRPFVAMFEPRDTSDGLIVFRRSELEQTVTALAQQLGLIA